MVDLSIDLKEMYTLTVTIVSQPDAVGVGNDADTDKEQRMKSRQCQIPGEFIEKTDGMKFLCLNRNQGFIRRQQPARRTESRRDRNHNASAHSCWDRARR